MIRHTQKPGVRHQNQFSSWLRSRETDEARQFVSELGKYNSISKALYNTQSAFVPEEPMTASRSEILGPLRKLVIIPVLNYSQYYPVV